MEFHHHNRPGRQCHDEIRFYRGQRSWRKRIGVDQTKEKVAPLTSLPERPRRAGVTAVVSSSCFEWNPRSHAMGMGKPLMSILAWQE